MILQKQSLIKPERQDNLIMSTQVEIPTWIFLIFQISI